MARRRDVRCDVNMYEGFERFEIPTSDPEVKIVGRVGGRGPAVLLLHGNPLTHVHWHLVAPRLAEHFTVVATDLRGYGDSSKPRGTADHTNYSFRRMAQDQVDVMRHLGFDRFRVAGHDRGARTAFRMALDHPDRVTALATFDVVPTGDVWARADANLALLYWHWSFLAQPAPLPERMIAADPGAFFDLHVRGLGVGRAPGRYPEVVLDAYRALLDDAGTVEAICEDYRAGATVDREHDEADRGRRRIECPVLVMWSARGALPRLYGDVLEVWRPWAREVSGRGLDATHFLVEDEPEAVAYELIALLDRSPSHVMEV